MHLKPVIAWCRERKVSFRCNELLSGRVYTAIGGAADILLMPDHNQLPELFLMLRTEEIPYLILGKGSNILVSDKGVRGAVISTELLRTVNVDAAQGMIRADAGVPLQSMLHLAAEAGLGGLEGLSGIPGTLGGAVAGNAGSFGVEMQDVLKSATVLSASSPEASFDAVALGMQYRKTSLPTGALIASVVLQLGQDSPDAIRKRMADYKAEKSASQPVGERSAGCVFRNPPGEAAGALIDRAGCKDMRVGNVEVSSLHANFFVNLGGGHAADYRRLMEEVSRRVFECFGILLEPEIRLIGDW
ncbi:MAG TPA: UDP-N-acetylmuramate dehydrogenase [Dissulfurispiraceae bacterium]|nr:UDP-N-acetylmuramate dehydrogenase [Dissulfurispiraceae bacterium]